MPKIRNSAGTNVQRKCSRTMGHYVNAHVFFVGPPSLLVTYKSIASHVKKKRAPPHRFLLFVIEGWLLSPRNQLEVTDRSPGSMNGKSPAYFPSGKKTTTGESPHSRAAIQLSPTSLLPYVPHSPKKWDSIGRHHKTALYNLLVYQLLSIVKSTSAGRAKDARPQRRNAGPTCKTIVDNDAQKLRLPVGIKKNDRHKRIRRRRVSRLCVCTQHGLVRGCCGGNCAFLVNVSASRRFWSNKTTMPYSALRMM